MKQSQRQNNINGPNNIHVQLRQDQKLRHKQALRFEIMRHLINPVINRTTVSHSLKKSSFITVLFWNSRKILLACVDQKYRYVNICLLIHIYILLPSITNLIFFYTFAYLLIFQVIIQKLYCLLNFYVKKKKSNKGHVEFKVVKVAYNFCAPSLFFPIFVILCQATLHLSAQ